MEDWIVHFIGPLVAVLGHIRPPPNRLKLGPGLEPSVEYEPMISEQKVARTASDVEDAVGRGGRLLRGGARPAGDRFSKGHFYQPTVLADLPDEARTMREETFGPVAPIASFASLDEVVRRANSTEYGLVASVFGKVLAQALLIAEQLEFGGVGINVNDVTELAVRRVEGEWHRPRDGT
jgi:acyl-CoA reductase-like NAD-dependent aldehyde dehydrogenase